MKKTLIIFFITLSVMGCEEEAAKQKEEAPSIIRNLPTQDRDFLLEPLEGALDDLRALADNDPSITEEVDQIDTIGWKGQRVLGKSAEDTVRIYLDVERSGQRERHWRYWDDDGELYYLETWIQYRNQDGRPQDQVAYKLYLEEGGVLISSYERRSYNGESLSESWRSSSFTPEEMNYILQAGKR